MSWRLWLIFCVIIGAIIGATIPAIPGYLVVVIDNYTAEIPLWLLAVVALVVLMSGVVLAYLLGRTWRYWHRSIRRLSGHSWRVARRKTVAAMVAFAEGDWKEAEKLMIQAVRHADTKLINYLIAAEAAQKQGKSQQRDEYLRLAKEVAPEADIAIGITQARAQIEANQLEQARANLERLYKMAPRHKYIQQLLAQTCYEMEDWLCLMKLLPELQALNPSSKSIRTWMQRAKMHVIRYFTEKEDLNALKKFWKKLPEQDSENESMFVTYVQSLITLGDDKSALKLLKKRIISAPTDGCYKLYSEIEHPDVLRAFQWLEGRLAEEPQNQALIEALATMAEKAQLFGKARDYWQKLCTLNENTQNKIRLAQVHYKLGENEEALSVLKALLA